MLYSQNLTQNIFQTGGRAPGAPVLDPPLLLIRVSLYTGNIYLCEMFDHTSYLNNITKTIVLKNM